MAERRVGLQTQKGFQNDTRPAFALLADGTVTNREGKLA